MLDYRGMRLGMCAMAVLMGAACQMEGGGSAAVETSIPGNAAAGTPVASGETDVEAPETFKTTDKALWDGRPSLGGVWVAAPGVKDPERVMIRNPANGKSAVGALFRREFDSPGPALQLSSDAAEALGLLAGQPGTIEVVALKRVEEEAPAPAAAAAPAAKATETAAAAGTAGAKAAADPAAKPTDKAASKTAAKGAAAQPIESKPIDKTVATASAAIEKAAGKTATAAAPAAAPATTTAAPAGDVLKRPFVQIGIFSVEANAKKAAAQMQKAGMKAEVRADTSQGKNFWRVVVGPAASVAERDGLVAKVKGLGYPDAYAVTK